MGGTLASDHSALVIDLQFLRGRGGRLCTAKLSGALGEVIGHFTNVGETN